MNLQGDICSIEVRTSNEERIQINIPINSDIYAWAEAFKTIMYWATFIPESIDKVINSGKDTFKEENHN